MRLLTAVVGIVLLAFATVGCGSPPVSPVAWRQIDQELGRALPTVEAFAGLTVTPDRVALTGVREGGSFFQWIVPSGASADVLRFEVAAIQPGAVDPASLQDQVGAMVEVCTTPYYEVKVEVITTSATMATVKCAEDQASVPIGKATAARLNGQPLADLTGPTDASFWDDLARELGILSPSGTMRRVEVQADQLFFWFDAADATNNCQPNLIQDRDGTNLGLSCAPVGRGPTPMRLAGVTGAQLYEAALAADRSADISPGSGDTYVLDSEDDQAVLTVRQGSRQGSAPIG